jgi:hypothetical protein
MGKRLKCGEIFRDFFPHTEKTIHGFSVFLWTFFIIILFPLYLFGRRIGAEKQTPPPPFSHYFFPSLSSYLFPSALTHIYISSGALIAEVGDGGRKDGWWEANIKKMRESCGRK